jgi:YebC/PmpR family DNA-binding regulatory protein
MSGHNKWSQIKAKKAVTDQRRSTLFSKLLRAVTVAAQKDPHPQFNPSLRSAMDQAREHSVPQENIDRAIKKSQESKDTVDELLIEAYGPEGTALLIQAYTDNRNRTVAEIKKLLSEYGGKWADPGSVMWMFEFKEGEYAAKFIQPTTSEIQNSLVGLMEKIDEHNDISRIYTNTSLTQDELTL